MSVIIRLQNLPWSANAHDIREFFKGLSIPEGGVHIVGGELGDAFIAFSSDEDARLAMQKSGTPLKGIQITLLLSSRTEMQKVIEAARQQALGMQSFMAPVAPAPPPPPPPVQPIAPAQLQSQPSVHPPFQGSVPIQSQSQRVASEDQPLQHNQNQNIYSGRLPQPNQPSQSFTHPYNPQHSQYVPSQIPYPAQKVPGFPPGVVPPPPGAMPSHYMYGQTPPVVSLPSTPVLPHHVPPMENTTPPSVSANFTAVEHQTYNDPPHTPKQPSQKEEEKEKEKKSSAPSSTSTSSREKRERDNKSRDDRRRRSKSRSRSKDRDRRRRHRSRSRSRDKSGRRKRSRSRERERTRERDRQRDRRDNRDSSRSHREKSERSSHETSLEPKTTVSENETGIPGLGDIPDDIPKEGLSIFAQPSNPIRIKESPSNNSGWIKASNVTEPKSINPSPLASETPQQKPFLLSNPPIPNSFGNNAPGAPIPPDPKLMKNSSVPPRPYPSPPIDGVFNKEPSPQEWAQENSNFRDDDRSNFRDDDRMYRSPNSNKNTNLDHSKRPWEESWDRGDLEREDAFSHRPFPHREDLGYNRDNDVADPRSQGRGMYPDRRDNIYTTRSFAGGFQSDFNNDFEDNFGRGGYRGRGRRGGFGRDNDRNSETARLEYEEPPFRDMHPQDFDRNRSGRGFFRGRGGRMPLNSDPSRERRSRTCSVEIRNVPTNASHLVIRDLFNGIFVPNGSIKIIGGERGERIGVALVQFNNTWDAFEAYKRSGNYILNSRVQIKFIDDAIYEVAKDIMYGNSGNREVNHSEPMEVISPCVYVNGLPVGCTDHDVAKLFEDFKFADIVLELEKGSRQPSGGCFVRFISPEEAENALSEMKHPNIDGNPVKIGICTTEAMEEAEKERQKIKTRPPQPQIQPETYRPSEIGTKEHIMAITNTLKNSENSSNKINSTDEKSESKNKNENAHTNTIGGDLLTDSIVIKNVSSDINETNIRDFFSDEGLIPEKVYFNKPDSEGKSDVFVVFPKISDAKHSIKKNSQLLGSTKVLVELVSKPSVMLAMGLPFDPRELFLKGHVEQKDIPDISEKDQENISNDDYQTKERCPPRKMSPSQYDNHIRGGRDFNQRYNRSDEPFQGDNRPRQPFRYRRDHDNHPSERGNLDDRLSNKNIEVPRISEPPQDFGRPGCVVALANIPYAATTENILHFFKGFDGLQPENVIRRYDERNRPTADSRVSLHSAEDALKAVETLNHKLMLGRPIYVKLVN